MAEVERSWTDQQLQSDEVSKKDIIKFLHEHASFEVLQTFFCCLRFIPSFEPHLSTWLCFYFSIGNNSLTERKEVLDLCLVEVLIDVHCIWYGTEDFSTYQSEIFLHFYFIEHGKVIPSGLKPYLCLSVTRTKPRVPLRTETSTIFDVLRCIKISVNSQQKAYVLRYW